VNVTELLDEVGPASLVGCQVTSGSVVLTFAVTEPDERPGAPAADPGGPRDTSFWRTAGPRRRARPADDDEARPTTDQKGGGR
jgi:hypothetical protein